MLHYLIHVYDDPAHAEKGLEAARKYAKAAAAVPHALHMPSHIFTRLGYWDESAATNERAWQTSESDVTRAGESSCLRDFHSLNYLEYAYLQLGRYRDARRTLDVIAAQYDALTDKKTAADTPELQSRHVRGGTIYVVPDRVVYGYFDMLTRYAVKTGDWDTAAKISAACSFARFRRRETGIGNDGRSSSQGRCRSKACRREIGSARAGTRTTSIRSADHHHAGERGSPPERWPLQPNGARQDGPPRSGFVPRHRI